jgi:hypothetical protein
MKKSEQVRVYTYLVIARASRPEQVIVWDTLKIQIGRHFEQDVVLENPEISREHTLLRRDGENYIAEDLKTANGTFYASHLKDFHPLADGEGDRTMLGLAEDDDSVWDTDPRTGRKSAPVRNLDAELDGPEARGGDEPPPTDPSSASDSPDDPDPLMDSAFDLGQPLPPVGLRASDSPHPSADECSAPTTPRDMFEGANPERRSVEITLQLDGVDPELLRLLQTLLGERFDTRALSLLLKAIKIG